jgi:superfamily II DNA or RNA helicase
MVPKLRIVENPDDETPDDEEVEGGFRAITNTVLWDLDIRIEGNPVYHAFSASLEKCRSSAIRIGKTDAEELVSETGKTAVICPNRKSTGYSDYETVFIKGDTQKKCVLSPFQDEANTPVLLKQITDSWETNIPLTSESIGLRDAQKGALFAIFSHWTRSSAVATVVLPTGTGKTETLLATIGTHLPKCSLVIVPSDALRTQFFEKACTWGRLGSLGTIKPSMQYPVVGMLRTGFKTIEGLNRFVSNCNIIVATMPILAKMTEEELEILKSKCDFVSVDEAHHLGAPSWSRVMEIFKGAKIIQFTATPFRNDGRHISGDIIYTYPLSRCQEEGFFRPIEFIPVTEFFNDRADEAICDAAVAKLREDIANGHDHSLMARTSSKERAKAIFSLYQSKHADLNPVLLYSGMKAAEKQNSKNMLLKGTSKIVVCVDMLGEGFDYPPLKIAAIHDPHKSLPITLQFIGRFTRSGYNIGNASVVANIADPKMQANISALYSQDANWDKIIRGSYEGAINHEIDFQNFINGFVFDGINGFSLRNIRPKYSAFVYSLSSEVDLEALKTSYNDGTHYRLALNTVQNVAVVVEKENKTVEWGNIVELENTNFNCFCIYHDVAHGLLFIFSSGKAIPDNLATTISLGATRLSDKNIHRCMHGINRLMLFNLGLKQRLVGPIRYRQYIGLDVGQGMKDRITENTYTAMAFGMGYENAERTNVGCSLKGKIWSRNAGALMEWTKWCGSIGAKIIDNSIDVDKILEGVLFPEAISELPAGRTVITADWSDFIFENMYERTSLTVGTESFELDDCQIGINTNTASRTTIPFFIEHPSGTVPYELKLTSAVPEKYVIRCTGQDCQFSIGKNTVTGAELFQTNSPMFWFDDSSVLVEGCLLVKASKNQQGGMFDIARATAKNWSAVNTRIESQGPGKTADSIQRAIIMDAQAEAPLLVFDDDGSGEMADVVAIYNNENEVLVRLYHCKYSSHDTAGLRITDAYEICGQAQKSVKWAASKEGLVEHLKKREKNRIKVGGNSRFETGGMPGLSAFLALAKQKRVRFEVVLVHPGISYAGLASNSDQARNMLRLMAATSSYLAETFEMKMSLIINQ